MDCKNMGFATRQIHAGKHDNGVGALCTPIYQTSRSEERRVGKECRSRWSPYH